MKTNSRFFSGCLSLALLSLIVGLSGCSSKPSGGEVVASVDGHKIYRSDLDKYYDNQTIGSNQPIPTGEQATSLRLNILRELIDNEIVMHRAEKLGLLATDDEVDRKLNEIKSPFSNEQFESRLKERKITLDDFKKDLRRSLTVDKVINKEITSKVNVSDQDITNYYNQHKSEFNLIEPQYHIAQIVVTTTPSEVHNLKNDKAQNEAEARRKIQMLENNLESGSDFATLAMNYSEDQDTATNGGDLGFAPESSLKNTDPATRDMVLKLKVGENSPIIQIINPVTKQFIGFRIVKLLAKEPAGQRELSDPRVQQAIHEQLRDRREQLLKSAYYEMLHDQAKVENYYAEQVISSNGTLQQ